MAFWLASVAMVAVALALVIPPFLRPRRASGPSRREVNAMLYRERLAEVQSQESSGALNADQAAQAREDLNREMLAQIDAGDSQADNGARDGVSAPVVRATATAVTVAIVLPIAAFAIYLQVGTPSQLFGTQTLDANGADPPNVEQMVARLEQRMRENPDDVRGWLMLGRSYLVLNRSQDARRALASALKRAPDDPEVLVSYAEVLTTLNDGSLAGEPIELVNRALAIQPQAPRALWLAGIHALNEGLPSRALLLWQQILDGGELDADVRAQVAEAVSAVRAAVADAQNETPAPAAKTAASSDAAVSVEISLSEELGAALTGDETVYVFARASNGPAMPLAVKRLTARQLPVTVVLDDSLAMAPELSLSRFEHVVVTARVSFAGTPRPAAGDLQGVSEPVATRGQHSIGVVIDARLE